MDYSLEAAVHSIRSILCDLLGYLLISGSE
jgi:hypothetical protein